MEFESPIPAMSLAVSPEGRAESIIRLLYHGFILRDLFGRVIPGLIVLVGILQLANVSPQFLYSESFRWTGWQWTAALGIGWLLGLVAHVPALRVETREINKRYGGLSAFYKVTSRFAAVATPEQVTRRLRLTLLFETSINCFSAAAAVALLALFGEVLRVKLVILAGGVACILLYSARVHMERAHALQDTIVRETESRRDSNEGGHLESARDGTG